MAKSKALLGYKAFGAAFLLIMMLVCATAAPFTVRAGNTDTFVAPISVVSQGETTPVDCTFRILDRAGLAPAVQIGNGSSRAIDNATAGELVIPSSVVYGEVTYEVLKLADNCFKDCARLTGTGLGSNSSVYIVEDYCFSGCTGLVSTGLEGNTTIEELGRNVFSGCTGLLTTGLAQNITVTSLGSNCFYGCVGLQTTGLESNSTVRTLDVSCFQGCTGLLSTGLGSNASVSFIPNSCFYGCTSLASTGLEGNSRVISLGDYCFEYCGALASTGLESNTSVTLLGRSCFADCIGLGGDLVLGPSVNSIGAYAFEGTSIARIYLAGNNIASVDEFAFPGTASTMYVPATWGGGAQVGTRYKASNGSLITMKAPVIEVRSVERLSANSFRLVFTTDYARQVKAEVNGVTTTIACSAGESIATITAGVTPSATTVSLVGTRVYGETTASYNTFTSSSVLALVPAYVDPTQPPVDPPVNPPVNPPANPPAYNAPSTPAVSPAPALTAPKKWAIKKLSSPKKKQAKVTWAKSSLISGYQIQKATNSKFTKGTKTYTIKTHKTTSKTIGSLPSKKYIYVRIRAFKVTNGIKAYGPWSSSKKVKVK